MPSKGRLKTSNFDDNKNSVVARVRFSLANENATYAIPFFHSICVRGFWRC